MLIVVGVTVLVPSIGREYFLSLAQHLSSFSVFAVLFVIQEAILLFLLRLVFVRIHRVRIHRSWRTVRCGLRTYFRDKRQRR